MAKTGVKNTGSSVKSAKIKPTDFVHLHNHTHYSVLDGLSKVPALISRVKELGMDAVAITDHGTMSGVIEFYQQAKEADIKPIIGMETYIAARRHTDKDPQADKQIYHLILLAMNDVGYQNLMRLSTIGHLYGFYYKPRIDRHLLKKYNEGLIVLSGCIGGEVGEALRNGQYEQAKKTAEWYKSVFGDRYYLELQDHGHQWDVQDRANRYLLKLSKELDIKALVTSDAHYLTHDDQEAHEMLLCVQTGSFYNDTGRMSLKDMDLYLESPESIAQRWSDNLQLLTNTAEVAARCNLELDLGKILLPTFPTANNQSEKSLLHEVTWQGLAWRYGGVSMAKASSLTIGQAKATLSPEVKKRAEYELEVISRMKYEGYFLIVWDFVKWGKEKGIVFGPGRGSAAGSIVSYALRITELDPLKYNLLFERFLNPDRISMPDIDIDIQDDRRGEVIDYVSNKYGKDRVANIVTFGKMAARNAIRDVARVLEVPYADADRLAKLVPPPVQGRHIPLSKSIKDEPDLKAEYEQNPEAKRVIDLAMQLEGTIRSHGVHAAGVVIAPDDIVKYVPLEMAQKGVVATQYSMFPIEDIGLLKMDFLGLSNLTIIKNALRIIRKVEGQEIDLAEIPFDDKPTYELLSRGDTTGVFQLESAGMKRYLKELGPTEFDDIIAMVALYRPGPLAEIPRFIEGKNNPQNVKYLNKLLEPILKDTYGVMVYQEQIIALLQLIAGYSAGEADLVRKAIGKKKRDIMQAEEPKFIKGCIDHGLSKSDATKLWDLIQPFADYSFNKAHAACYGLIAYWTAYLKTNYPEAFMAALMTSNYNNTEQLALDIAECKDMGIDVLKPDINESFLEFGVVQKTKQIRFGLAAIKNVGVGAVESILEARDSGGKFLSVEDFISRVDPKTANRKTLESLIKAGAFDAMESRDKLLYNLDALSGFGAKLHKEQSSGQTDLFQLDGGTTQMAPRLVMEEPPAATPTREQLQWERELLGVYLSDHPLEDFRAYLQDKTDSLASLAKKSDKPAVVGGMITTIREITTKNNQRMAFVGLEGLDGSLELIVFPKTYEATRQLIVPDNIVQAAGKISTKDREGRASDEVKLLVDDIKPLDDTHQRHQPSAKSRPKPPAAAQKTSRLYVHVKDPEDHHQLMSLKKTLNRHPGSTEAILVLGVEQKNALRLPFGVDITNGLKEELISMISPDAVVVK